MKGSLDLWMDFKWRNKLFILAKVISQDFSGQVTFSTALSWSLICRMMKVDLMNFLHFGHLEYCPFWRIVMPMISIDLSFLLTLPKELWLRREIAISLEWTSAITMFTWFANYVRQSFMSLIY